uniref:Non-specific serine/threonine protein kinase n=1 Tax=Panagrellus redivivus TaxID=6233 RepID=A0A7E4VVB3_PANRE
MDPVLESLVTNAIQAKNPDGLIRYLAQLIAEQCQDEIDTALTRSMITSRSLSSSPGIASTVVERRLLQRRLRSAAKNVAATAKFRRFKEQILNSVAQAISKHHGRSTKSDSRPGTGFDTLFSMKDFSSDDDDDETILLTSFNLSQSLKLANPGELDQWIGKLTDAETSNAVKIESIKKLISMSALALYRSNSFVAFLNGDVMPLYENLQVFPMIFPLFSKLANTRDLTAFVMVFRHLQAHSRKIIESTTILVHNKIKFVDYVQQFFRLIPPICNRENRQNIKSVIDVFVLFFELPENFGTGNLLCFALLYACLDPSASAIGEIAHFYNFRQFFGEKWVKFGTECLPTLNNVEESNLPEGFFVPTGKVFKLWRAFIVSIGVLTLKYVDLSKDLDNAVIEKWFLGALKLTVKTGQKVTKLSSFVEKRLLKASEDLCFCDRLLQVVLSLQTSTLLPSGSLFCRILLNLLTYTSLPNASNNFSSIVITLTKDLLNNRRRASTSIAVKLIHKVLEPLSTSNDFVTAFSVQPYQPLLRSYLQPANTTFSEVVFKLGISTDKQLWRAFRGHSIIESPGFGLCQHAVMLTSDDKKVALRTVISYLQGSDGTTNMEDSAETGLNFINGASDDTPVTLTAIIIYPGLLLDAFRTFELENFFKEESAKAVERRNGSFFRRFAKLLKNINFGIECRNRLKFPMLLTYLLQKYCRSSQNHIIFDEFCIDSFGLLTAATLGAPSELFHVTESLINTANGLQRCKDRVRRLPDLTHGFYKRPHRLYSKERQQLSTAQVFRSKYGSNDPVTSSGTKAPSVNMLQWLGAVFDYAVYLNKAPTRQSAHRQAVHLRIPSITTESHPDWFLAAVFLASDCHPKLTSTVLRQIETPTCFWPNSFESTYEFIDTLSKSVWPHILEAFTGNPPISIKFLDLVNFVYSCGFGIIDFDTIEDYLRLLLTDENTDAPEKRVAQFYVSRLCQH